MFHLPSEVLIQSFTPYPRGRLRAASGASGVRQSEGLQDASEHLTTRNSQLGYNITAAQPVDRKHKVCIRKHTKSDGSKFVVVVVL